MFNKRITSESFENLCDLEEVLGILKEAAGRAAGTRCEDTYPIILVEDDSGNPLDRMHLYETPLTDGSKVYKVVLCRVRK
jgi:hypothetical protein